jgi:transmembrane sensor
MRQAPGLDEVDRLLGWRQRIISLDGDSLADAAERFNRYNRVQISIDEPALGAIELSGRFNSSEALAFARAAAKVAHARVEQQGDQIILSK